MKVEKSNRKGKRFVAIFKNGKQVHFGLEGGSTFIDHKDIEKRKNYIARHRVREDWNNPYSAGALSRWILWEKPNLQDAIRTFNLRFDV
jgi:hypothetical protein